MANTMTPSEFATIVKSDGRTVRKFLRSIHEKADQPGKGKRWELKSDKRSVTSLTKRFNDWTASQETARQERAEKAAAEAEVEVTDEVDEDSLDA